MKVEASSVLLGRRRPFPGVAYRAPCARPPRPRVVQVEKPELRGGLRLVPPPVLAYSCSYGTTGTTAVLARSSYMYSCTAVDLATCSTWYMLVQDPIDTAVVL